MPAQSTMSAFQAQKVDPERQARIEDRRKRIQARVKEKVGKKEGHDGKAITKDEGRKKVGSGPQQVHASRSHIDKVQRSGSMIVDSVQQSSDERENIRRINEEERRRVRRQNLDTEARVSAKRNAAVAMRWASILEKDIPEEILADMMLQREDCDRIVLSKDTLIQEFERELRNKDETYVKSLKKQAEDIDTLIDNMNKQTEEMCRSYAEELQEVERGFLSDREELMHKHEKEITGLLETRQRLETDFMERKASQIREYQGQFDEERAREAEEHNSMKIKLETKVQRLEQDFQQIQATFQLNTEKLEYNFLILFEKDIENLNVKNQLKRKTTKLSDALSNMMTRYNELNDKYKSENNQLTEEYKRVTEQFKDLQTKFLHFQRLDAQRYRDIWDMNEKQVTSLMQKVLKADKIVHEQHLGLEWAPPSAEIFQLRTAEAVADASAQDGAGTSSKQLARPENKKTRLILQMLCDEGGFLVEGKVKRMLDKIEKNERNLMKVESIIRALAIDTKEGMEMLVSHFVEKAMNEGDQRLVDPTTATSCLRNFVDEYREMGGPTAAAPGTDNPSKTSRREEQQFWERMSNVISSKTHRLWENLYEQMQKLNTTLMQRQKKIEGNGQLEGQNLELRRLLSQYMSARVNDDLYIPPAQMLQLQQQPQ